MNKPMQGFPLSIKLDHRVGETTAELMLMFYYIDKAGIKHCSHPHLCTDGLSIPKFLWSIFGPPFASVYLAAGIIHDSLCYDAGKMAATGNMLRAQQMRLAADDLFREMLLFLGSGRAMAWAMYRGARIGSASLRRIVVTHKTA